MIEARKRRKNEKKERGRRRRRGTEEGGREGTDAFKIERRAAFLTILGAMKMAMTKKRKRRRRKSSAALVAIPRLEVPSSS